MSDKFIRVDPKFEEELREIKKIRYAHGIENPFRPFGTRRYTKAITKHPLWQKIKFDIANINLEEDRKKYRR